MKLWIGHYLENTDEWFLVWANSKEDAFFIVDGNFGEPDIRSLKQIDYPGCIGFFARKDEEAYEEGAGPSYYLEPNQDEMFIERSGKPSVNDWMKRLIEKPLGPPENVDVSELATHMGISQPEVMAAYIEGFCPACGAERYDKKKGCEACGYAPPSM